MTLDPSREQTSHADPGHSAEHAHPSPLIYVKVAIFLAVVTAIEVAVYYVPPLAGMLVPILLVLSLLKFGLVVLYFMHLKFDSRTFRRLFVTGIALALLVYGVVLASFLFSGKVLLFAVLASLVVLAGSAIVR